jgi:hypothetical protein
MPQKWDKINEKTREIQFPEFGSPEDFQNISDIVKQHVESDQKYESNVLKITTLVRGKFRKFMDDLIRASMVLEHVISKLDKFRKQTLEMREVLNASMDQH